MTGGGFRREEGAKKELKTERALGRGIALAAGPSHYRHLQDKRTRGKDHVPHESKGANERKMGCIYRGLSGASKGETAWKTAGKKPRRQIKRGAMRDCGGVNRRHRVRTGTEWR